MLSKWWDLWLKCVAIYTPTPLCNVSEKEEIWKKSLMEICIQIPKTSFYFWTICPCLYLFRNSPAVCICKFVIVKSEPKSKPNIWFLHFQANYFWAVGWNLWAECKLLWVQPAASFKAEQISPHFAKVWKNSQKYCKLFCDLSLARFWPQQSHILQVLAFHYQLCNSHSSLRFHFKQPRVQKFELPIELWGRKALFGCLQDLLFVHPVTT